MNFASRFAQRSIRAARARAYDLRPRPWGYGYLDRKRAVLQSVLRDPEALRRFRTGGALPKGYGQGLDERLVEYPWAVSRLGDEPGELLDAGSVLNFEFVLDLERIRGKRVTILTLAPEVLFARENVSYLFGDLRRTSLRDGWFDEIVCLSTLEHVGMDNTLLYTTDRAHARIAPDTYLEAMAELRRVIRPGGHLLLTVPFGTYEDFGWMQQFDRAMLSRAEEAFRPAAVEETFFRYRRTGWSLATEREASDARYYDIHSGRNPADDGAAAARAVACVQLTA